MITYVLPGQLNGVKARLVVDMAAFISVISSRVWDMLGDRKPRPELENFDEVQLEVANEGIMDTCSITEMKIKVDEAVFKWSMTVVSINNDFALGQNFYVLINMFWIL